jgi:glucose/arabinose dehydrogenase
MSRFRTAAVAASLAAGLAACSSGAARRRGDLSTVPTPPGLAPTTQGELVVEAPEGFTVEPLARGLDLPGSLCFDDEGNVCVLESGGCLGNNPGRMPPRIRVFSPDGAPLRTIDLGGKHVVFPAWGIAWRDGAFFISHRDEDHAGAISRVEKDGRVTPIVQGLPSQGDHATNQLSFGPEGKLYFAQGTATNSGVVGVDDFVAFGWAERHPAVHDVPARTIVLTGKNFATADPRGAEPGMKTITGAFMPFGQPCERRQGVKGDVKCNGAVLRCDPDGKNLEVYCWGLRDPFGLGFGPGGKLYATCQGMELRGSRPIANDVDALLFLRKDAWYGWPDYTTDLKPLVDDREHAPPSDVGTRPEPLVDLKATDVSTPERADVAATFPRSMVGGFTWVPPSFGSVGGTLLVAEMGSLAPSAAGASSDAGFRVVSVNEAGEAKVFLANEQPGPASRFLAMGRGIERPVDVKLGRDGSLYVSDLGVAFVRADPHSGVTVFAREGTGFIWKVTPKEPTTSR